MADDTMFQDAIEALHSGDKARAKDLLTRLLKAEQTNATYWLWMSAAVDNTKERIYCLQTALKLDPENASAKRGLILLGALPPDDTIQPFPLNRPRAWEEKLLLQSELPKPKGIKAFASNPVTRLAGLGGLAIILCGLAYYGMTLTQRASVVRVDTFTPGPSPTFTSTPTKIGATAPPTASFVGPTPLWMLLDATYTPTPLYVNTPRPQSADQFRVANDYLKKGDFDNYIASLREIARVEGNAPDILYYIGEAYRLQGNYRDALAAYNDALKMDNKFGPAYLGLARARLIQDPNADVTPLFDLAEQNDPRFGEIYLERANFYLFHKDPKSALKDLDKAAELMPASPMVQLAYAQAYLALEDNEKALEYAKKANELDITILPPYLIMGQSYAAEKKYAEARAALETYTTYAPKDSRAQTLLGQTYYETGDYQKTIAIMSQALEQNSSSALAYYYRGLSYAELDNMDKAVPDLERAFDAYPDSFELNLALTRAYYETGKYGSAYLKIVAARSLDETPQQQAQVYYWTALIQEKRNEPREALKEWLALLALPANVMTPEMRTEAQKHVAQLVTPTVTPRPAQKTATAAAAAKTSTALANKPTVTPAPKITFTPSPKAPPGTPTPTPKP
jgi:tetratricopeptide (TPR) repeat protein